MTSSPAAPPPLSEANILITGGTGSFGHRLLFTLLDQHRPRRVAIFSRDELKQYELQQKLLDHPLADRVRFFLGDVRDRDRLVRAFDGVDYVVHAAALKQVPAAEYNPLEFIKTNILGAANIIEAAIDRNVKRVVALSTDKAANPVNLYGATKLCSDKLFGSASVYSGAHATRFWISLGQVTRQFRSIGHGYAASTSTISRPTSVNAISPDSRQSSMYASIASRTFSSACSRESPSGSRIPAEPARSPRIRRLPPARALR